MYLVCRTIGRTVGLLDRRTIGMSDYRSDPGDNTFAHIPERRLHDCAQFTCILMLRLRTLPFQYTLYLHNLLRLRRPKIICFKWTVFPTLIPVWFI